MKRWVYLGVCFNLNDRLREHNQCGVETIRTRIENVMLKNHSHHQSSAEKCACIACMFVCVRAYMCVARVRILRTRTNQPAIVTVFDHRHR